MLTFIYLYISFRLVKIQLVVTHTILLRLSYYHLYITNMLQNNFQPAQICYN